MSKGRNRKHHHIQQHTPQPSGPPPIESTEFQMANELVNDHQGMINELLSGRRDGSFRINDLWNSWYNNLMAICFTLGGALIAISPGLSSKPVMNVTLFWAGNALLVTDGIYILLKRKAAFERESIGMITLGYEEEYWALRAKNCMLDYLVTGQFDGAKYKEAKDKLITVSRAKLKESQDQTNKIDSSMDVMTSLLLMGIWCFTLSAITNWIIQVFAILIGGSLIIYMLFKFRNSTELPDTAIRERKKWDKLIEQERLSPEERLGKQSKSDDDQEENTQDKMAA